MRLRSRVRTDRVVEIGALAALVQADRAIDCALAVLKETDLVDASDAGSHARLKALQTATGLFLAMRDELREQGIEIVYDA